MADPSSVMLDFLLALKNESVAAGLRAEGAAEETIRVADQAELAVAVGTLIKATRLLHDRALQVGKLGHAIIGLLLTPQYLIRARQFTSRRQTYGVQVSIMGRRSLTRI